MMIPPFARNINELQVTKYIQPVVYRKELGTLDRKVGLKLPSISFRLDGNGNSRHTSSIRKQNANERILEF